MVVKLETFDWVLRCVHSDYTEQPPSGMIQKNIDIQIRNREVNKKR